MTQSTFSVRMDNTLKKEFEDLCNEFGMNMTTAINVFARAVVREKKIPFEIISSKRLISRNEALKSFNELRKSTINNFPNGITMDEINHEISKVRNGEEDI